MTEGERSRIQTLHRDLRQLIVNNDRDAFPPLNKEFHDLIHEGAHNGVLHDEIDLLNKRLAPYRRIYHEEPHALNVPYIEHDNVVRALIDRNEDTAALIFRAHTALRAESMTEFIAAYNRQFERQSA